MYVRDKEKKSGRWISTYTTLPKILDRLAAIINTYMKQWSTKKYDETVANYVKQTFKWKEILYGCKSKNSLSWLKVENSCE